MNDERCKVSIITVVYNGVRTIEQTIQSVIRQTYKNIEYIVVDGLSTDGTKDIIEKYGSFIHCYISEKDEGIYDAMNKGLNKATGDIVGIINSDDWYACDAVEAAVHSLMQKDVDLVYGKVHLVMGDGNGKVISGVPLESIWYQMAAPHPTVFVKKKIYERYGLFDINYKYAADYDLLLRFFSEKVKFGYLDKVIAYFRYGGSTTVYQKEVYDEGYVISMSYIDKCKNKIQVLPMIEENYQWRCFVIDILKSGERLHQLLCKYFSGDVQDIIIFGTGDWGEKCYRVLSDENVKVMCFADNNVSKWNTKMHGIRIINPDELCHLRAFVLIAVNEGWEEIRIQLKNFGNKGLQCVSVRELYNFDKRQE